MKMMANRKNRIEKGTRAVWFGSNPHSNGDVFSRVVCEGREESTQAAVYTNIGSIIAINEEIKMLFIN